MRYDEVLQIAGYPEQVLMFDFETYHDKDYSLNKLSTIEYIMGSKFDFLGAGTQLINTPIGDLSVEFTPKSDLSSFIKKCQHLYGFDFEAITLGVQNAKFDVTILKEKFGISPPFVVDILDLSRHYDARMKHDLGSLAKMFTTRLKGNAKWFTSLHYEEMDADKKFLLQQYCENDVGTQVELFKVLLPKLTNPEIELALARHTLELYLRPGFKFDFKAALALEQKMKIRLDTLTNNLGCTKKQIAGNISFVKLLEKVLPKDETVPVKKGKNTTIPALAKDDEGCKHLLTHKDEQVRNLMAARLAVKSWPLHIKRIGRMTNQAIVNKGYLRVPLHYYGSHTGRWSGAEGINLQNLGKRGRTGAGIDSLIQETRGLLCAPKDCRLLIADSAQIEARILAWLAGQNDLLEAFAKGDDIYSNFATNLFQHPVRKPTVDDPPAVQHLLTIRRGFGKDTILGAGYGLGSNKFYQRCRENTALRALFDSGEYDIRFVEHLIKLYRSTYKSIPIFWNIVEKCFRWVTKYPQEVIAYTIQGGPVKERLQDALLTFWNDDGTVNVQLPSGRVLYYRHAKINSKNEIQWRWGHLWGGSITENIVQSIARDLLGWWLLEFEKFGLPVICHVHDEIIAKVKKNDVVALERGIDTMQHGPEWAKGLPLEAEGVLAETYKGD